MSLDDDLQRLAEAAATNWPEIAFSGRLDAAIRELYRSHLRFPPFWTQEQCDEFVADHADTDASQLATQLDDLIDIATDRYEREHGIRPHGEDAEALIEIRCARCGERPNLDCDVFPRCRTFSAAYSWLLASPLTCWRVPGVTGDLRRTF
jgi:hypothetical protein